MWTKHYNLSHYFDRTKVVYSDGTIKSKPDSEIFIKAANRIGLDCSEVLILEDSYSGIQAAENAKPQKIIIVDSNNTNYDRWNHQVIKNFSEIGKEMFELKL